MQTTVTCSLWLSEKRRFWLLPDALSLFPRVNFLMTGHTERNEFIYRLRGAVVLDWVDVMTCPQRHTKIESELQQHLVV